MWPIQNVECGADDCGEKSLQETRILPSNFASKIIPWYYRRILRGKSDGKDANMIMLGYYSKSHGKDKKWQTLPSLSPPCCDHHLFTSSTLSPSTSPCQLSSPSLSATYSEVSIPSCSRCLAVDLQPSSLRAPPSLPSHVPCHRPRYTCVMTVPPSIPERLRDRIRGVPRWGGGGTGHGFLHQCRRGALLVGEVGGVTMGRSTGGNVVPYLVAAALANDGYAAYSRGTGYGRSL
ncbi:hypothetical protein PIB30_068641 [Stylosanthes scabra]|uniref:Uncharacterized protein n=1 Tax=Stylosanthes scabra TaxID=79078 RepID=A0ABU6VMK2_9FABA|nr:hypothetical protein [Stylosanthes scabra]